MELKILKGKEIEDRVYEVKEYIGLEDNEVIDEIGIDEDKVLYIETHEELEGDEGDYGFYSRVVKPKDRFINSSLIMYVLTGNKEHLLAIEAYKDYEETFDV